MNSPSEADKHSLSVRNLAIAAGALILLALFVHHMKAVFVSLVLAMTLASAIAPLAEKLERFKIPRVGSVLLVYVGFALIYSILAASLYPAIEEQAHSLYKSFPAYSENIMHTYSRIQALAGDQSDMLISTGEIKEFVGRVSKQALHFTSDVLTGIVSGILVLFLTAYFVIEAPNIWPKMLEWVPVKHRSRAAGIIRPLENRLGGYVKGQLLVSLAVAFILGTGLYLIKVPHALLLGILAGLLNLVPFVGSMLTAVLAIIVAAEQSLIQALLTVGLFALEQWAESNFIVPLLLGSQVELHPLIVLFSILIGASFMGLPGALISVPLATMLMYLAEEFYLRPLKQKESSQQTSESEQEDRPIDSPGDDPERAAK